MPEIVIEPFPQVGLHARETVHIDINVLPGTTWHIEAQGPGRLNHEDLQTSLNRHLAQYAGGNFMRLRGSTARLTYDCIMGEFCDGQIVMTANRVDATGYGMRFTNQLLGVEETQRGLRRQEEASKAGERRDAAEKVARKTLERMLNEDQRAMLKKRGWFEVVGNLGNLYRLHVNGYSGNIYWIDKKGKTAGNYCAHPATYTALSLDGKHGVLPISDSVIGQKLMLETDEAHFLSIANLFGGTYPPNLPRGGALTVAEREMQGRLRALDADIARRRVTLRRRALRWLWFSGVMSACSFSWDIIAGVTAQSSGTATYDFFLAGFVGTVWGITARFTLKRR